MKSLRATQSGQTLIFMTMIIVMIAFAALLYFDVNKTLHVKALSRNGGDAAALSGARWQAISLNLIGSLNIAQSTALINSLSAGEPPGPESVLIEELQRRISFSGPMLGVISAQQAAKNNGLFNDRDTADYFFSQASILEGSIAPYFTSPFQPRAGFASGWNEVADMVRLVAEEGCPVLVPSQLRQYENGWHLLLVREFYIAIENRNWCWFHNNPSPNDALRNYTSWDTFWQDLPHIRTELSNSPFFPLNIEFYRVVDTLPSEIPTGDWATTLSRLKNLLDQTNDTDPDLYVEVQTSWANYNRNWYEWTQYIDNVAPNLPWDGNLKNQYNYAGTDAAVAISAETIRRSDFHGGRSNVEWGTAAKPFGSLKGDERPNEYGIVLPAFTDVRLIPFMTSITNYGGDIDPEWYEFIFSILPVYMQFGPDALSTHNRYARQLIIWEQSTFRNLGIEWLSDNSGSCIQTTSGGSGRGGGSRYGH